jgi:GNAT superfamily N-acetyltransferase
MADLTFQNLNIDSPELDDALRLYVNTFQTESITSYNFNFSHPKTVEQYYQAVRLMTPALMLKGDHFLVAKLKKEVVGLALIMAAEKKGSFFEMSKVLFPDIFKLLPLLTKINYRNLIRSARAMNLSSSIKGNYATLQVIAIAPNHQGQGIGKQFIAEIHKRYQKQSEGIYLYTANRQNKEIYEHFNYELLEKTSAKNLEVYHMVYHF